MNSYRLYGVQALTDVPLFQSPVPLPALAPGEHSPVSLLRLPEGASERLTDERCVMGSHGRELWLGSDRPPGRSEAGQPWRLSVVDVVDFFWEGGDPTLYYQLTVKGSEQLLAFWFVHIVLPLYLTLERGYDFLHAAAVEVDERPILFVAPSTGGKSTLGDYFLRQGHPMLHDDKVATFLHRGEFYATPSHPHYRPYRQFEVLGQPVENFARQARPIHAVYLLDVGEPDATIEISEITGYRKFEQLMPSYLFNFRFLLEQRLHWLARLADRSPVFRVSRPWDMARLEETYRAICAHSRGLREAD